MAGNPTSQHQQQQISAPSSHSTTTARRQPNVAGRSSQPALIGGSSPAFQQIKQTQSSLARLSRGQQLQQQQQQQQHGQINQSSQQQNKEATTTVVSGAQKSSSSFVDCLIRRFKDCFSEDFCTVPMFVVGNLSPGSDGTHLILPPCVSLGRQNISRFANPKNNLRHMNSIRESCKSIEELDLGGNKLSDLIEVYKILQCTPNLKFLNLSENDLSKTSPVAMANNCCPTTTIVTQNYTSVVHQSTPPLSSSSCNISSHAQWPHSQQQQHRTCLAPLNQNNPRHQATSMTTRRHSTLGQTAANSGAATRPSSSRHQLLSRGATSEARRMTAATAALAQSKKTSPAVARSVAAAAAASGSSVVARRQLSSAAQRIGRDNPSSTKQDGASSTKTDTFSTTGKQRACATSTMSLARSLSSLSAKDVRASLANRRMSARTKTAATNLSAATGGPSSRNQSAIVTSQSSGQLRCEAGSPTAIQEDNGSKQISSASNSVAKSELFPIDAPIVETDGDVDMNEPSNRHQSINVSGSNNNNNDSHHNPAAVNQLQLHYRVAASLPQQRSNIGGSSSGSSNFRRTFRSIKALALNNTGCPWRVVCSILSRMPNLEELHLSLNNYERIDLDPNEFKHHSLKRLYLCNNPKLTNWQELDKLLSAFPSLEALSIADCNISQIPDNLDRAREWQKLCGLNINGWPIKEWPVVDRLNQLPSLIDLKCRNLEVLQSIDEPRHHLIARLPKLQRLNGSEIEEREHAEKAFLRFFMANSHLERPSRFHELVQIHGEVTTAVDVDVDLSPPSQASVRVIHLNRNYYRKENQDEVLMSEDFLVKLMDNVEPYNEQQQQQPNSLEMDDSDEQQQSTGSRHLPGSRPPVRLFKDEGQEVVALDVDLRQSVRKFKSTLASLFHLDQQNIILYYIDHEMVGLMGPELIKHNQKKLWNYNVQNGDQFIVEER